MTDTPEQKNPNKEIKKIDESGFLKLPFKQEDLKKFIIGLLGKPQTIAKSLSGVFEIDRNAIININNLIDQRISQQNDATLIRLNARLIYDDNSSILLSSLDEIRTYNEVKPVVSTGVYLSWQYLIKFNDKQVPERQEIEIAIISSSNESPRLDGPLNQFDWSEGGYIHFNIKHTARTWGADIEALLSDHFSKLIDQPPYPYRIFKEHRGIIARLVNLLILSVGVWSAWKFGSNRSSGNKNFKEEYVNAFYENLNEIDLQVLSEQIEFLTRMNHLRIPSEPPSRVFLNFAIIGIAILFAYLVENFINKSKVYRYPSFLLLTESSFKNKINQLNKLKYKWLGIIVSIILGIISSLIATYIFEFL